MMETQIYTVHNEMHGRIAELPTIGCGLRRVLALEGRRFAHVIELSSLSYCTVPIKLWHHMRPKLFEFSPASIPNIRHMIAVRAQYVLLSNRYYVALQQHFDFTFRRREREVAEDVEMV